MFANSGFITSSVGQKYLMAVTAIFWSLFVMLHMLGNLLIFVGAESYNKYSHALISNPVIYLAELILLLLILVHIVVAFNLKLKNMRSKPKFYAVTPIKVKSASLSSRTMIYTGTIMLAFLIWHLITFKWGEQYTVIYNGVEMRDIYKLIFEKFQSPLYVLGYCFVMVIVGFHLLHGVKSIFQSVGINHPRYNNFFQCFGYSYAVVVAAGFFSLPIYVYFAG